MEVSEVPKSAQDVFERNTIPDIRNIEKQLHANIQRSKERLRALVGGNYRDLLSTAEEIVTLDQDTRKAETQISDISRRCKPPQPASQSRSTLAATSAAAQLRFLTQCITCASTALQSRSILLSAELVVISRLLLKSLGESQPPPKSIESLQSKVVTLRGRLLRVIKVQLAHPRSQIETLVSAVCAYCLVTSASSEDAIDHFRKVRLDKLVERVGASDRGHLQVEEDFRYLVVSVQSLKALLGRSVNDALSALQKHPLLQDQKILKMDILDVDRLHNLIPQDVLSFTPYIKRVLLKKDDVQKISNEWIGDACRIFSTGFRNVLASTKSVEDIFSLRRTLLSILLPVYFSIHAQEVLLETLRSATNARVLEVCRSQAGVLVQIGHDIGNTETVRATNDTLWKQSLLQRSQTPNKPNKVNQVRVCHLGTNGSLAQSIKRMRIWSKQVGQLRVQLQILESARWQDLIEEPDDEDDGVAQSIVLQLTKDDPKQFKDTMSLSTRQAVERFKETIHEAANRTIESTTVSSDDDEKSARAVYLLRSLRESSLVLADAAPDARFDAKDLASKLHSALTGIIVSKVKSVVSQFPTSPRIQASLFDDLPSPEIFKLLRNICKSMEEIGGTDIWSSAAVSHLKDKLRSEFIDNADKTSYIRSKFDEEYIRVALGRQEPKETEPSQDETRKKAIAYWQRTKLLFGALS